MLIFKVKIRSNWTLSSFWFCSINFMFDNCQFSVEHNLSLTSQLFRSSNNFCSIWIVEQPPVEHPNSRPLSIVIKLSFPTVHSTFYLTPEVFNLKFLIKKLTFVLVWWNNAHKNECHKNLNVVKLGSDHYTEWHMIEPLDQKFLLILAVDRMHFLAVDRKFY